MGKGASGERSRVLAPVIPIPLESGAGAFAGPQAEEVFTHSAVISTVRISPRTPVLELPWHHVRSAEDLLAVAVRIAGQPRIALDTETTGLDPAECSVRLLQIATPEEAFVIDGALDLALLAPVLADPGTLKVLHNAAFDVPVLRRAGIALPADRVVCTLTLERLLSEGGDPTTSNSLASTASRRLKVVLDKRPRAEIATTPELTEVHWEYAARDVIVLLPMLASQERELRERGLVEEALTRTRTMRAELDRLLPESAPDRIAA